MSRFFDRWTAAVVTRRHRWLGAVGLVTLGFGLFIPSLRFDPSPTRLTQSSVRDRREVHALFRRHFGDPDHTVLVLIEADDVLARAPLQYLHGLLVASRALPHVAAVDGITLAPLVHEPAATPAPTLSDLEDSAGEPPPALDAELEAALFALVQAAPERFPYGLSTLADRLGQARWSAVVEGERVSEAEAATLRRALAEPNPLHGRLLSRDHTLAALSLSLDARVSDAPAMRRAVGEIDALIASRPPPPGVKVAVGGLPHLFQSIVDKVERDNQQLIPWTLVVCIALLFAASRWLPGTFLPLLVVGSSAVITLGAMGLCGEPMNVINNLIPLLLIIIGISDSIHLIGRYREELDRISDRSAALVRTARALASACFLTSLTTAVGLCSLVVSRTGMLQHFGLFAAAGVMVAYAATIIGLPAAMAYFRPPAALRRAPRRNAVDALLIGLTKRVVRRPWRVLAGAAVALGVLLGFALGVRVDSRLLDEFERDDEAFVVTRLLERKLDGIRPLEVLLTAPPGLRFDEPSLLAAVDRVQRWLREQPGVLSTLAATDLLAQTWARVSDGAETTPFSSARQVGALYRLLEEARPNPLRTLLADRRRIARIQVRLSDIGAQQSLQLIDALRQRLAEALGAQGVGIAFTGEGYSGSVGLDAVVRDLSGSLATAVALIFVLLGLVFRSARWGWLSLPSNLLPLVGTLAWMAARGIALNAATAIIFSVSFGLAVDGSIHLIARYREEANLGLGRSVALMRAVRGAGKAIVVSGAALACGFSVLLMSSFVPVRHFGELIAVTVATCVVSTLVVQPALLRVAAPRANEAAGASRSWTRARGAG